MYVRNQEPYPSAILRDQRNAPHRQQIPQDDPFLEVLFSAICRTLFVLPGETFVDQARRWTDALRFTAALNPRNEQEWLRAADVTIEQFSAIHSLVMRKRRDISPKQRAKHERDFLEHAKAMQDARLRYDLLRQSRTP
jgi:head-tail adaptor